MKKICISVTLTVVCFFVANAQIKPVKNMMPANVKTGMKKEDILGLHIFKALKEKDNYQWQALYQTGFEFEKLLQLMLAKKSEGLTQQKIDEMVRQRGIEAEAVFNREFKNYLLQADSLGIKWKDAVMEKFDVEKRHSQSAAIRYLDGIIWFRCKKNHFVLEGIEAVELENGYKLQAVKGFRQVDDGE